MSRRIQALIFLGWRYAIHLLKTVWPFSRRPGLEKFLENYLPDGITLFSTGERAALPRMERCIGCDACLHPFFLREGGYDPRRATPRDLALSLSRSMPDYKAARAVITGWKDLEWFDGVCPRGVDLKATAALMRRHLAEYDAHHSKTRGPSKEKIAA